MSDWQPGWSLRPPQKTDQVLLVTGHQIARPEDGWMFTWDSLPDSLRQSVKPVYVGEWNGRPMYTAEIPQWATETLESEEVSLRDALLAAEQVPAEMLGMAVQVNHWWRDHRFCGRCGEATGLHPRDRAKWCARCEISWYPRLSPCVIVVIRRGDTFLLARSSRMKRRFFSLIAGFVEPGESTESAVAREVKEETGLEVTNIRYQLSQPWPFPHQLMLGFTADYAGGELVLQEDELAEADWFRPGHLPPVPPNSTISGQLIRAMEKEILGGDWD